MSLVGSILRPILSATIISLCLKSCLALSSSNKAPLSGDELSNYFLDDAFEVSLNAIDAPEFFSELPEAYKPELDEIMAPLEAEFDRYSALRAWAFEQIENYQFEIT
jgi:hypothetical protein